MGSTHLSWAQRKRGRILPDNENGEKLKIHTVRAAATMLLPGSIDQTANIHQVLRLPLLPTRLMTDFVVDADNGPAAPAQQHLDIKCCD